MKAYPKLDSTVVLTDIRNFTQIFEKFQKTEDDSFLKFMEEYYHVGLNLAELVSDDNNFYLNSSGDGILTIFFGKDHELCAYLYGLVLYQALDYLCHEFNRKNGSSVSFGIGMESGYVQKVSSGTGYNTINTYLGSVINIASRIESTTKNFHRTRLIIGERLYERLVKRLFEKEYNIVEKSSVLRKNYEEVVQHHNEMNKLNQNLMLFYIFEHTLKGVDAPMQLFRLSPTLSDSSKSSFYNILKKLAVSSEKYNIITAYIADINDSRYAA